MGNFIAAVIVVGVACGLAMIHPILLIIVIVWGAIALA